MFPHLVMLVLAQAPAERIRVEWVAPEGCPDRAALASRLEDSVAAGRTFTASVHIDEPATGQPWRAVVTTDLGDGQRSRVVEAPDCEVVTNAAVLVITLAATNVATEEPAPVTAAALPPPAPVHVEAPADEPAPTRGGKLGLEEPTPLRVQVLPLVGANVGVLPVPGVSVGLGVVLGRRRLRGEVALFQWLDSESPGTERGARFSMTSAKLKACWLLDPTPALHLGPCVGAEGGLISAEGRRISAPARNRSVWVAALAGVTLGFDPWPGVHPWVSLEAGVNVIRPEFVVSTPDGDVSVHRMAPPVGRVTVGLEFSFP